MARANKILEDANANKKLVKYRKSVNSCVDYQFRN